MDSLRFTFPEVLSFIGVFQCVYIIVHVFFHAGRVRQVILPVMFFFILAVAFLSDFARGYVADLIMYYDLIAWGAWAMVIPLSVLLIVQMAKINHLPSLRDWSVLLIIPFAFVVCVVLTPHFYSGCTYSNVLTCREFEAFLDVSIVVAGAVALLIIWLRRDVFSDVLKQPAGKERYWLILALVLLNILFLALKIVSSVEYSLDGYVLADEALLISRTVLGLGFVYLVSTSMFRIYPSALFTEAKRGARDDKIGDADLPVIEAIDQLMTLDKVYHEPSYSRSDLAKELNVPEPVVSRVINLHYKKSFPQLLNEYRVEDAKRLLLDTDANIAVVSREVGFNSISSFNRVFKAIARSSPSSYRDNMIK